MWAHVAAKESQQKRASIHTSSITNSTTAKRLKHTVKLSLEIDLIYSNYEDLLAIAFLSAPADSAQ